VSIERVHISLVSEYSDRARQKQENPFRARQTTKQNKKPQERKKYIFKKIYIYI